MESKNIGSTFDSWLKKEGIHEQVSTAALQRVNARWNGNGTLSVARQLLDLHPADLGELLEMLAKGFPATSLEQFLSRTGFPPAEAARYLRLSRAQLARRRRAERIGPEESDRLLRLAELHAHALELFEDRAAAVGWLTAPALGLGTKRPIDCAATEWGAREVHDLIGRIEHGVFS